MLSRMDNPVKVKKADIEEMLSHGFKWCPVIQFSESTYTSEVLSEINDLCVEYGDKIEVRFYGHYREIFNAEVLREIPDVVNLTLNCLRNIENLDVLSELKNIKNLNIGIESIKDKDFLSKIKLDELKSLVLAESKCFDLKYLIACEKLRELFISGQTKNIDQLNTLRELKKLSLSSMPKKQSLKFVNEIEGLESLTIFLGGRESIEEIENETLQEISIVRVRGLEYIGNLGRFPKLESLNIEDQIQLIELKTNKPLTSLKSLSLLNCKNFRKIFKLEECVELSEVRFFQTSIDLMELIENKFPEKLQALDFRTGKIKEDKANKALITGLGY